MMETLSCQNSSFNRTFKELKFVSSMSSDPISILLLIEPLRNWNKPEKDNSENAKDF